MHRSIYSRCPMHTSAVSHLMRGRLCVCVAARSDWHMSSNRCKAAMEVMGKFTEEVMKHHSSPNITQSLPKHLGAALHSSQGFLLQAST